MTIFQRETLATLLAASVDRPPIHWQCVYGSPIWFFSRTITAVSEHWSSIMRCIPAWAAIVGLVFAMDARAQSNEELALQLANPVASLVSVPFQFNLDHDIGPDDSGDRLTLNVQPVVPLSLNEDWNLISRTILPVVDQQDIFPGAGDQFGLGDTVQSLFFSPKAPTAGGWIWGAGPVFLLPTATDRLLGSDKWGLGPTAVALRQQGPWTYGGLFNHIWSVAGKDSRSDINSTFLQPFVSYTTPEAWSFTVNMEATRDWENNSWNLPLAFVVGKVTRVGSQLVQLQGGLRYYLDSPAGGPEGFGLRFGFTLLLPR